MLRALYTLPSTQNHSSEDKLHKSSPPPSKGNTRLVPNLRGTTDLPVFIVVECRCKGIPFDQWLLAEELVDLVPDRFIGGGREWQSHVNL